MSTTASVLRIGNYFVNLSKISYIWFDEVEEAAFLDFGRPNNSEGWDLILTGTDARALKAHLDRQVEVR